MQLKQSPVPRYVFAIDAMGEENFDADAFVADIDRGRYDDGLIEGLQKLTAEQLQEVVAPLTKHLKKPANNIGERGSAG
jgi:hypothetical protein